MKLFVGLAFLSLGLTACKEDYFDQEAYDEKIRKAFPVQNVDPNHTWATFGTSTARITVNGDRGEKYRVAVYKSNPLYTSPVVLLADAKVMSGATVELPFSYELAHPTVYVACYDKLNRRVVQAYKVSENSTFDASFFGEAATAGSRATRATEAASPDYAKTASDYLNPSKEYWTTKTITVEEMRAYEPFTDDLINDQGHIELDGGSWTETIGGSDNGGSGITVNGSADFLVSLNDNPSDGASRELLYYYDGTNSCVVATVEFGGTGSPAESASRSSQGVYYSAKIARPYYVFKPLVNCQLNFEIDDTYNGKSDFIVYDQTEGRTISSTQWYGSSIYIGNLTAHHSYKIYLGENRDDKTNPPLTFYGFHFYGSGTISTGGESSEPTVVVHNLPGDGHHYRVASGTEITKIFHLNANYGDLNDVVVYVEGTLHLNGNTLNGPTLVVANGGKIVFDGNTIMSNGGRFVVLSGGRLETGENVSGVVYNVSNGMPCYNAGTIDFNGEININGCDFYNCGTMEVGTLRNTSQGKLTNFGSITAVDNAEAADTYNCTFINGCYLHYTSHAGIGHLTMLPNSRLDVDGWCEFTQNWTNGFDSSKPEYALAYTPANPNILMDKSVVNVGTAYCTNTVFQGPSASGEYAIVKMNAVQVGNGTDLMQRQNCFFDWNIYELYKKDGGKGVVTDDYKYQDIPASDKVYNPYGYLVDYYKEHLTKFVTESEAPITMSIPASTCTGAGYNPDPTTVVNPPQEESQSFRFCFEDYFPSPGDYDFNDCVITLTASVDGTTVTLDVSLDAVGATKQIAAALNLVGINPEDIVTASSTYNDLINPDQYQAYQLIKGTQTTWGTSVRQVVNPEGTPGLKFNRISKQYEDYTDAHTIISLFNDAHWCISRQGSGADILVLHSIFYNTITNAMNHERADNTLGSRVMTYTFEMVSEEKANLFKLDTTYDLFLVEKYDGRNWEVHTYPFKFDQVLASLGTSADKLDSYIGGLSEAYPWAILVPATFKYPIEWQSIGSSIPVGTAEYDAARPAYENFSNWAADPDNITYRNWYETPTDESLVYPGVPEE